MTLAASNAGYDHPTLANGEREPSTLDTLGYEMPSNATPSYEQPSPITSRASRSYEHPTLTTSHSYENSGAPIKHSIQLPAEESHNPYAVVSDIPLPELRTNSALDSRIDRIRKWLVAVFVCVALCVVLSAAAVVISLANLYKPSTDEQTPVPAAKPLTLTPVVQPEECGTAINLTEHWRKDSLGRGIRPAGDRANCDTARLGLAGYPWFRFSSYAGSQLLNNCPATNGSCGTHIALWSNASMPQTVGVAEMIDLYGSWTNGCKHSISTVQVMKCSTVSSDYIYKYTSEGSCDMGFCGMS